MAKDWEIVGFGVKGSDNWFTSGSWTQGDFPHRDINSADLNWITEVVVKIPGREGVEDDYFTIHGPWETMEDLNNKIDDESEHYGET